MCTGENAKHAGADTFRVLFVDEHNACRSQMAEAIAQSLGQPRFVFSSAGLDPRAIDARTLAFLKEKGHDVTAPGAEGNGPDPEPRVLQRHRRGRARGAGRLPAYSPQPDLPGLERQRPVARRGLARGGPRGLRGDVRLHLPKRPRPRRRRPRRHFRVDRRNDWSAHDPTSSLDAGPPRGPGPRRGTLLLRLRGRPQGREAGEHRHPEQGLRHDGQRRPGLGRGIPQGRSERGGRGLGRRVGRRDRRPSQRSRRHRQREPGHQALRVRAGGEEHRQEARRRQRRVRRPCRLRPQGQPDVGDHPRAADRPLRRGRKGDPLVGARSEDPGSLRRHDRPREPPVELGHVRVLPRARAREQGLPPRLARPERLQGGRRARRHDADSHRLQRNGVRNGCREEAEGRDEGGRSVRRADRRRRPRQELPAGAFAPPLHPGRASGGGEGVHRLDPLPCGPEDRRGERVRSGRRGCGRGDGRGPARFPEPLSRSPEEGLRMDTTSPAAPCRGERFQT